MIGSMPTRCCISTAMAIALMRTRAMGLSPMLMQSAPSALSCAAPSMHFTGVEAARRIELHADDEAAGGELLAQRLRLLLRGIGSGCRDH